MPGARRAIALFFLLVGVLLTLGSAERIWTASGFRGGEPGVIDDVRSCGGTRGPAIGCKGRFYPGDGSASEQVRVFGRPAEGSDGTLVRGLLSDTFYPADASMAAVLVVPIGGVVFGMAALGLSLAMLRRR